MTGDRARRPRLTRAESEDLLDGGGSGPLRELLAAVSAPAHREETAGEAAATSAFVAAHRDGAPAGTTAGEVPAPGPGSTGVALGTAGWWRAPTRFVAALALALATAGVAVGAATVVLRDGPPAAPPASSAPAPAVGGAGTVDPSPLPDDVRVATCGAWRAAGASTTTDRAADPAFAALISAAGGVPNVDGFCAATPPSAPASPVAPVAPVAPTTPGSAGEPGAATSSTRPSAGAPRGGPAPGADAPGASPERTGSDRGEATGGRSVGPPATPPGRATDREGPARGRSVGPPAVPPGQDNASRNDRGSSRGQG
ncbi:MAG TPA: hypothetical protein VNP37_05120 [Actinomycetospora sp.]|nr:hypothetical protein [Actinomycetospora sp.]